MHRRTLARIELSAIQANFELAQQLAPGARNVAVVKADGYGHGMTQVAEALSGRAAAFAVATVDEGMRLRASGIDEAILILEGGSSADAFAAASEHCLTMVLSSEQQLEHALKVRAPVWLKLDTGMHRLGIAPRDLLHALDSLRASDIEVQAVCTHLACADEPGSAATLQQLKLFQDATLGLKLPLSIANSAAILAWPQSHAEFNRPGIMLYGASPLLNSNAADAKLVPAMTFLGEIIAVRSIAAGESVGYGARWTAQRNSQIATVAAGYADGYPRHAPCGTPTFVHDAVAPLVGTVSMDMITIDVTDLPGTRIGDAVELWGRNVSVDDVAVRAGTIGYELLTGVSARVPRIFNA